MSSDGTNIQPNVLPSVEPTNIDPTVCHICNETMNENDDCLVIQACSHVFHRSCIETYLSTSSECAVCKRSCQLNELKSFVIVPVNKPQATRAIGSKASTNKHRGRGAMSKYYNTRSTSRNLFSDVPSQSQNSNLSGHEVNLTTPNRNTSDANPVHFVLSPVQPVNNSNHVLNNPIQTSNNLNHINFPIQVSSNNGQLGCNQVNANANAIDYNIINRMISDNLSQMLSQLNLIPGNNTNINTAVQNQNANIQNANMNYVPPQAEINNSPINPFSPSSYLNSHTSNMTVDKVSSVIQHWNLKFDGSSDGLHVEEFLYRIKSLTNTTFNGDFKPVCNNLHILLTGKARNWYWRYHKQVQTIVWADFCDALRSQYREFKSSFDIRDEIRNRKQRSNESFDVFFESVTSIMDKLTVPMGEGELIEVIARNLRPEIRQDLLYVPIHSISHLRKLVQMRENFLSDEYVRKNLQARSMNVQPLARRHVAEIDPKHDDNIHVPEETDVCVEAFHKTEHGSCWNCDGVGHHWQDCLQDRSIFCYGCGAKNTYKPNCTKCANRTASMSKNFRPMGPQKDNV